MSKGLEQLNPNELRRIIVDAYEQASLGRLGVPSSDLRRGIYAATRTTAPVSVQWREDAIERVSVGIRDALARIGEPSVFESWGISPGVTSVPGADVKLITEMLRRLKPILYYAEQDALTPGTVLHSPERPGWPEVIFCHPDDLPGLRAQLSWLSLRPFREWSPRPEDIEAAFQEAIAAMGKDGTK